MKTSKLPKRLSFLDAAFLYLERKECPMNIGAAHIFEGKLTYDELVRYIESRLSLVPRYLQRVSPDPFNLAHPEWEFDPNFNIKNHIFKIKQNGTFKLKDLANLSGQIMSELMDRSKPLWELYVIEDFEDGNSAMIAKVHHCMADGISGVDLMKVLFEVTPETSENPSKGELPIELPKQKDLAEKLFESLFYTIQGTMTKMIEFQGGLLYMATVLSKPDTIQSLPQIAELIPAVTAPPPILPFNAECSGKRRLAWTEFSFTSARKIRNSLGGTVNDVVLTALTKAVSDYTKLHGYKIKDNFVRFMVPVSLRQKDQRGSLGNLISFLPVEIPLDIENLAELFIYVNQKMSRMKETHMAEILMLLGAMYAMTPAPIQAALCAAANIPFPPFNMVATNVPGPQIPLYLAGKKMLKQFPYVPVGYKLGLGCAILSYNQTLYFGISSDAKAMKDVERFKKLLEKALIDLNKLAE
jgi:diacylglycerol O-acyltransferase